MMIHAVFMSKYHTPTSETLVSIRDHQCQCLQTAQNAIDLMFETFCEDDFFQTWYAPFWHRNKVHWILTNFRGFTPIRLSTDIV